MYAFAPSVYNNVGGQKRVMNALGLRLQTVVSHQVDAGNQTKPSSSSNVESALNHFTPQTWVILFLVLRSTKGLRIYPGVHSY